MGTWSVHGTRNVVEGDAGMSAEIDRLLDLRNYVTIDIDCWGHDAAKQALTDVVEKIDKLLKEIKK